MTILINSTLVALLLITAWQDFRHRGIWWGLLPLLLAGFAFKGISALGAADWATVSGVAIIMLSKLWFLDRMVWLFEDMIDSHEEYRNWLR